MSDLIGMSTPEYRELLKHCVHCGLCLEACPTYSLFGTEMDAPRGRIALMRAVVQERVDQQAFLTVFAEHITLCLECRACESACPSGVQYGKLIEGARVALEAARHPALPERFVRWLGMRALMPHVDRLKMLSRLLRLYEVSGLQRVVRTLNVLPEPLEAMERILPPIPSTTTDYSRPAPAMGEKRGTVAFFYGCIQEAFLSNINSATVRVLQRNGYEVHFPLSQTCCGAAQWHTGDEAFARDLAKRNIEAFEPYDVVVNNAGGCGLTLKEYPDLLKNDPEYAERAQQFASKVQDFSEFLYTHLNVPPTGALRIRATYSDSCHLRHGQEVIDQPRALLRMIPGLELVELRHPERCCGSAGIYNIVRNETATAILDDKVADIANTGADVVVTSNTGCHMQILAGIRRARLNTKVLHIAEVLDLSYMLAERGNGEIMARLGAPMRHPRPLFGAPRIPERWLAWQARRLRRYRRGSALVTLAKQLGPGQVIDDPVELVTYQVDGGLDRGEPVGVAFPYNTADVQKIILWARGNGVPIVARGAGTGLAGGAVAHRGGLLLEFSQMKQLVEFDVMGRTAVVQPGMVNLTLDEIAKGEGLYFPPDPASGRAATIGGNIGANAGGPHCFKYGVTTNYITGLEVVFSDGRKATLGGQAFDYPTLDLVGLITGAEGTLAVVTEASVRLVRNPPAVRTLLAAFNSVAEAGDAVSAVIAAGLVPATLEMMGQRIMQTIEAYNHPGLPTHAGAALVIDVDGYPDSVGPQLEEVSAVLRDHGAIELRVAESEDERARIWYARKSAAGAMARLAVDHYTVDGSVPRSKLADTLRRVIQICQDLDLEVLFLLHAGDGNLHPMVLVPDPDDEVFIARLREGGRRMAELFVAQGGAISGEHGIGIEKQAFMPLMYGSEELSAMRDIKEIFDPSGLLNPDKIFPQTEDAMACIPPLVNAAPTTTMEKELAPSNADEVSSALCGLAASGRRIRVMGGGSKSLRPVADEVILSTRGLDGILECAPDDLYVRVGAGTRLDTLEEELGMLGMWVPLVSPWPEATVGGVVSTSFNGPLRMRYGGVRDLVLAMTVVLGDGRILHLGRPVMKNVAGYDLQKLFIGSYGVLGVITDITFKLSPRPREVRTLSVPVSTLSEGLAWGQQLLRESLVASSIMLIRGWNRSEGLDTTALTYTAEGLFEDVETEMHLVADRLRDLRAPDPTALPDSGSTLWAEWLGRVVPPEEFVVRVGVAPGYLTEWVQQTAPLLKTSELLADFGSGQVYIRGQFDLDQIRHRALAAGGYCVVFRAGTRLSLESFDPWGYASDADDLLRRIKARWDPAGCLNPGVWTL